MIISFNVSHAALQACALERGQHRAADERRLLNVLREIAKVRQVPGESCRRWFNDEAMDLYIWLDENDNCTGFQLTYGKPKSEKALTWQRGGGFNHTSVDEGARPGKHPASPILATGGEVDADAVLRDFDDRAKNIDADVKQFVTKRIGRRYRKSRLLFGFDATRLSRVTRRLAAFVVRLVRAS